MTRETFHHELDELKKAVVQTTRLVESALGHAMQALLQRDVTLALQVIEGDAAVNEQQRIRTKTFDVIARQAPVARDLRGVITFQLDHRTGADGRSGGGDCPPGHRAKHVVKTLA